MLKDVPLFDFVVTVEEWHGKWFLCEWCVWWTGVAGLVEMVEITGDLNEYKS